MCVCKPDSWRSYVLKGSGGPGVPEVLGFQESLVCVLCVSVQMEKRQSKGQILGRLIVQDQLLEGSVVHVLEHVFVCVTGVLWSGAALQQLLESLGGLHVQVPAI